MGIYEDDFRYGKMLVGCWFWCVVCMLCVELVDGRV